MTTQLNNAAKTALATTVSMQHAYILVRFFVETATDNNSAPKSIFLHGPVGVGKSALVKQLALEQKRNLIDLRMTQMDVSDLRGIPYLDNETKTMKWAPPVSLPTNELDTSILFLDELNCASPAVQASAYQLILDRKVGEYKLPKGVTIIAAGNRDSDKGVTFRMAAPLLNRFVHIEVDYCLDTWLQWAERNEIHASIIKYLKEYPKDFASTENGNIIQKDVKAFATPRSWHYVSDCLKSLYPTINGKVEQSNADIAASLKEASAIDKHRAVNIAHRDDIFHKSIIASCIGPDIANRFVKWLTLHYSIDYDAIFKGDTAKAELAVIQIRTVYAAEITSFLSLLMENIGTKIKLRERLYTTPIALNIWYKEIENAFTFLMKVTYEDHRELLMRFVINLEKTYTLNYERLPTLETFRKRRMKP
jgi:MoxR-like ATPase